MDLWQIAPRLSVKDVIGGGDEFRNRYWGSRLTLEFGVEGTGRTPAEMLGSGGNLEKALVNFRRVVETAAPVLSYRRITFVDGRDHIAFEAVHLPLAGGRGDDGDGADDSLLHIVSAYDFDCDLADLLGTGSSREMASDDT